MSKTDIFEWLRDKKVWIVGCGRSGAAVAKVLKKINVDVFATDAGSISDAIKKEFAEQKIAFEEEGHNNKLFLAKADLLVTSPGIPLDTGLPFLAVQNNIPVISEIEVASWFVGRQSQIIGVTGTNGKSTVTNYLSHLFAADGFKATACGNIGLPFAEIAQKEFEKICIELSSYQLESTYSLVLDAAVFLNIQNDHLARYKTLNEYLKAKWRIIDLVRPGGTAVIGSDVLGEVIKFGLNIRKDICFYVVGEVGNKIKKSFEIFPFPSVQPIQNYGKLSEVFYQRLTQFENIKFIDVSEEGSHWKIESFGDKNLQTFVINQPCLPGRHNLQNLTAATFAAIATGLSPICAQNQWEKATSTYKQLSHRLEQIGDENSVFLDKNGLKKRVQIYNDSKATNVESAIVAIKSFSKPVRILLGGEPKGDSYLPFLPYMSNPLVAVYPFGKAASLIADELKEAPGVCRSFSNMLDAAEQALTDANDGDTILLSPACASFDEFKNFEHRGDCFRQWAYEKLNVLVK